MRSILALLPALAGLGYALPQDCSTTTTEVIVPTKTATYSTADTVTTHATTAKDLGTFTYVTTISSTTTLQTLTSTATVCSITGIAVAPVYTTIYTNASQPQEAAPTKRELGLYPRDDGCVITVTSTTTYGQTYTYVPNGQTTTYTDYTAFTQATVTTTKSGGRAYAIASVQATTSVPVCGSSTVTGTRTSTVTQDSRCAPSAMASAFSGFGLEWMSNTPSGGAHFDTTTGDASECCQLCAEAGKCAASSWDVRTGQCTLEFPVNYQSGELSCGQGLLAYYDAGPRSPMAPGTGLYVAALCGNVEFGSAKPDDGT